MRRNKAIFLTAVFLVLSAQALMCAEQVKQKKDDLYEKVELFASAVSLIRSEYVNDVNSKDLIYGALKGMMMSLDSHSQFLDPESFNEMKVETEGKFGGLGIELTLKDGILTVISAIEDTPAFKAGLKPNDRIVRIEGKSTRNMDLNDAVKKLRGEPGTPVVITVLREDEKKVFEVSVTRGIIQIKSIKAAEILEKNIGYIKLVEFQENTPKDLAKGLSELKAKGMDSLILDLRNNPGGLLDISVKTSEMFLTPGLVVVSTKGRAKSQDAVYKANAIRPYVDFPMIVLVNQGSASASEIMAGAIKDNKRGIIVGTRTFGKGSVQTIIPLSDGSAVRLTTAKYLTPSGQEINGEGIMPDVEVQDLKLLSSSKAEPTAEEKESMLAEAILADEQGEKPRETKSIKYDIQLDRAVDLIKGIKAYEALKETQDKPKK